MPLRPQVITAGRNSKRPAIEPDEAAPERFADLLGAIYQGPYEQQPWSGALNRIQMDLKASWAALLLRPAAEHLPAHLVAAGGPLWLAEDSPYLPGGRCPPGVPFHDLPCDRMLPVQDISGDGRAPRHAIGADILVAPDVRVRLRICRGGREGAFNEQDLRYGESLLPHFKRALHGYFLQSRRDAENRLLSQAVERFGLGLVLLDQGGALLSSNGAADGILRRKDGLRLLNAMLACDAPAEDRRLRGIIKGALQRAACGAAGEGVAVSVTRTDGCSRLGLVVQPLAPGPLDEGRRRPAVTVFLRDPLEDCNPAPSAVGQLFGLTRVETRLALEMTNGATLDEAAAILDIRRNTARTHLRSIFAKVGIQRQAGLVRVILNSVAVMAG
ncbi:MAG: helix-turn-helix transcriptional regulator [Nevskia sp.]|nr:helix-turn-helix transcriptional regulator [Nevskia sp.]